jgi:hypothetical protein
MKSSLNLNAKSKTVLAIALSISLIATACSAQWISVALADLPVLTQMALNIGTIAATLDAGTQINPIDVAAIQNISAQASKDLNLLATLYNEYKSDPTASALEKIQSVIADINQSLPALLQAAHISDPVLSTRIAAAINVILTTVASFGALIPQSSAQLAARTVVRQPAVLPTPSDLKKQWNQQVCGPTGNSSLDFGAHGCALK